MKIYGGFRLYSDAGDHHGPLNKGLRHSVPGAVLCNPVAYIYDSLKPDWTSKARSMHLSMENAGYDSI